MEEKVSPPLGLKRVDYGRGGFIFASISGERGERRALRLSLLKGKAGLEGDDVLSLQD